MHTCFPSRCVGKQTISFASPCSRGIVDLFCTLFHLPGSQVSHSFLNLRCPKSSDGSTRHSVVFLWVLARHQPLDLGGGAGSNFMEVELGPAAGLGAGPDLHRNCDSDPWHKIGPAVKSGHVLHNYAWNFGPAPFLHNQGWGTPPGGSLAPPGDARVAHLTRFWNKSMNLISNFGKNHFLQKRGTKAKRSIDDGDFRQLGRALEHARQTTLGSGETQGVGVREFRCLDTRILWQRLFTAVII